MELFTAAVHTSNISSCQKKLFQFSCGCEQSINVGPLVFLLYIFAITENIMKRPVCLNYSMLNFKRRSADRFI
jgi:hypothetical protein